MFRLKAQCFVISASLVGAGFLFAQPPGGRGGPPGNARGGAPADMILQIFQQADANSDGNVTKAELAAAMQQQLRGGRGRGGGAAAGRQRGPGGPGGPPPREEGEDEFLKGPNGPPPTPGQILPEPIVESLNLTKRQTKQLAALQAEVNKRLAAILTDEQELQLKNAKPPGDEQSAGRPEFDE